MIKGQSFCWICQNFDQLCYIKLKANRLSYLLKPIFPPGSFSSKMNSPLELCIANIFWDWTAFHLQCQRCSNIYSFILKICTWGKKIWIIILEVSINGKMNMFLLNDKQAWWQIFLRIHSYWTYLSFIDSRFVSHERGFIECCWYIFD